MSPPIRPAINPLAHRAAIDALEAQRAAYQRFARMVEQQQPALADGDGQRAAAFADEAVLGFQELEEGAKRLGPLVAEARETGTPDDAAAMRRELDALTREATRAELAIRNLSVQLEAWRDAYGRQLDEMGIAVGGASSTTTGGAATGDPAQATLPAPPTRPGRGGYGPRGAVPSLIDRKG
jgi:hypothetical protein